MTSSLIARQLTSQSRIAFLQYARKPSVSLSISIVASHTVGWLLSSDSEHELIETSLLEKCLCSNAILIFYEQFDLVGPESVSVNDLEHTLVLLFLSVIRVKQ